MGIYVDYTLAFTGTEEELLLRLDRLRQRILNIPVDRVGEVTRIEPVVSMPVLMILDDLELPIPPEVAKRLAPLRQDHSAAVHCIHLDSTSLSEVPARLRDRWFRPALRLQETAHLWDPDRYPQCIRHGTRAPGRRCLEVFDTEPDPDETFYGLTIMRPAILQLFVDAMLRYGYVLDIDPGQGCETVVLGLSTYRMDGPGIWLGSGFAKTQYARDLQRAHTSVIGIVDELQAAGLLLKAGDNSGYYDHRDWGRAKRRIAAELAVAGAASGMLEGLVQGLVGPDAEIKTAVDNAASALDRLRDLDVTPKEIAEGLREALEGPSEDAG